MERSVEADYRGRDLTSNCIDSMQGMLEGIPSEQNQNAKALHKALQKQLAKINMQEGRLIDLAADGSIPTSRIRTRLNQLTLDRRAIEDKLGRTDEEVEAGAALMRASLELTRDPAGLYSRSPDHLLRHIKEALFDRFFLDERGDVTSTEAKMPSAEFAAAEKAFRQMPARAVSYRSTTETPPARWLTVSIRRRQNYWPRTRFSGRSLE